MTKHTFLTPIVVALTLLACDGTMNPVEDADGGELDSPSGLYGVCAVDPTTCDDIVDGNGDLLLDCCRGDIRYWCQAEELFYTECTAGCTYDSSTDSISCSQEQGGGGSGSGEKPGGGGTPDPPTDPGPGF
jgi:hypothetical protein